MAVIESHPHYILINFILMLSNHLSQIGRLYDCLSVTVDQELLHGEYRPAIHFLEAQQDMAVGFEVGRAFNHIENIAFLIHHEVKAIEILIV